MPALLTTTFKRGKHTLISSAAFLTLAASAVSSAINSTALFAAAVSRNTASNPFIKVIFQSEQSTLELQCASFHSI